MRGVPGGRRRHKEVDRLAQRERTNKERYAVLQFALAINTLPTDAATAHYEADMALIACLKEIGFEDVAKAWELAERKHGFIFADREGVQYANQHGTNKKVARTHRKTQGTGSTSGSTKGRSKRT
jgi:hypothetical protein